MTTTTLSHYEILGKLGEGGMGVVYKAHDAHLDRLVAIKVLPPDKVADAERKRRFLREAKAASSLNHANIITIHDIDEENGADFMVMEYIAGQSLTRVIERGAGSREALQYAVQIADGLAAAHAAGIVHRDLKPDNILVTDGGRVKILDFGLARIAGSAAPKESDPTLTAYGTEPGLVMGTVGYMSPEQARGRTLDARSDQFSLGVILYELVTGKHPFKRASAPQTLAAIIEVEPEGLPPSVPAPLRWIIERCLAKEPSARYESTHDLYRDLQSLSDHLSDVLSVGPAPVLSAAPARWRWTWAAAVMVGILAAGGAAYRMGIRSAGREGAVVPIPLTSSGGYVRNPSFSPDGSEVVFAWNGPREGNSNLYVKLIGSNDLLRLTNNDSEEGSPAWSPDGKRIAFARSLGGGRCAVMIISPLGGSERKLIEILVPHVSPEDHSLLAWTPDGRYLAVSGAGKDNGLSLVSADTAERRPLTQGAAGVMGDFDPAFAPEGDRVAFVRQITVYSSRVRWMALGPGYQPAGAPHELRTPEITAGTPLWTSQRQLLFSAGPVGRMWLYRATASANAPAPTNTHVLINGDLAFHRKTGRLIYTSGQFIHNLFRIPLDGTGRSSRAPERVTSTSGLDMMPHFSPDGKGLAFGSMRFGVSGIWTMQIGNTLSSELASSRYGVLAPGDWAPDGRSLLYFGNTEEGRWQLYRVAVDTGKVTRLLSDPADSIFPTWSRDGAWIYFSSTRAAGSLQLFRMPAAGGSPTLVAARCVTGAQESPDGRWLYFADWPEGGLYRMPIGGGEITRVIEHMSNPTGYAVAKQGVYYWARGRPNDELHFLDVASGRDDVVFQPPMAVAASLTLSPDGRWLCFPLMERSSQELMMLENWR